MPKGNVQDHQLVQSSMTLRVMALAAVMGLLAAACSGGDPPAQPPTATSSPNVAQGVEPTDPAVDTQTAAPAEATSSVPPEIDVTFHSVPLEEVYFDTFDGGSVPLSASTPELRLRLLDAIPPIDDPMYGDASSGDWLALDDLVLGYVGGDQAYAYPFKIMNYHEIVNDEIAGVPVLVSYCPLCRSAIVYDRRVGGETLSFGNTSALYESDLVMVDRDTGSYWWQVVGMAIVGPLTGTELQPLPSEVSTWADWKARHPSTLVLTRDTGHQRPYERDVFAGYSAVVDSGRFAFPVGEAAMDERLPASALVVGVVGDGVVRAYAVDGLDGPINDVVGDVAIVVFPSEGGATVFSAMLDGELQRFVGGDVGLLDVATESTWTQDGAAIAGAHEGAQLEPVPSRTTFWFAFVGAFPDVEVYSG